MYAYVCTYTCVYAYSFVVFGLRIHGYLHPGGAIGFEGMKQIAQSMAKHPTLEVWKVGYCETYDESRWKDTDRQKWVDAVTEVALILKDAPCLKMFSHYQLTEEECQTVKAAAFGHREGVEVMSRLGW